jgi:hypothetical protein
MSLLATYQQVDRQIKGILLHFDVDSLNAADKHRIKQIKLACNEIRLDIRDYEYAEKRADMEKWAKIARHNIAALERLILELDTVFGASDVAALSAQLDQVRSAVE